MINNPDTQEPELERGKLFLPTPPGGKQQTYNGSQQTQFRPEQLIRHRTQPAPKGAVARLVYFWRKDPAYKVLIVAMAMVLLAGFVFVSLASAAFLGNSNLFSSSSAQNPSIGANPTGTVDLRPSFPTPGGGNGINQSSQPPMQATPALQSTADHTSPTPGGNGTLAVQITNIPPQVIVGRSVNVDVNTSEPGVTVELVIRYSGSAFRSTAGPQITDSSGNATITWFVLYGGFGQKSTQAIVYGIAVDQNGQKARSQPVTVQVLGPGA